jgi:hypothetical protein
VTPRDELRAVLDRRSTSFEQVVNFGEGLRLDAYFPPTNDAPMFFVHGERSSAGLRLGDLEQLRDFLNRAVPSLPAGGGDGRAGELLWRVANESADGWSAGLDPALRDLIDEWSERVACPACRGRGVVLHFTESGLDSEYLTCERCNGAGRPPASSSAGDEAREVLERAIQQHLDGCREWVAGKNNCCFAPAEYVLWGKLIPREALGPRCYRHAKKHVGDPALRSRSGFALVNVRDLAADLAASLPSPLPGAGDGEPVPADQTKETTR